MFEKYHQRRIVLVVVLLFALFFPPLLMLAFHQIHTHNEETLRRHRVQVDAVIASAMLDSAATSRLRAVATALAAAEERDFLVRSRKAESRALFALIVGGLFMALSTTFIIMRKLVTPLISLCAQIREIATHPAHDGRIRVEGGREFEEIAKAFNRHMDLLQEKDSQLFHAQQMELAGLLAGGMAHEFNTVLTSVTGFTEVLKRRLPPEDPHGEYLDHILAATKRGAHLTRALIPFKRHGLIHRQPVDIELLVQELQESLNTIIGDTIQSCVKLSGKRLLVMGDRYYLQQVFINLVNNARDAMPDGGTLCISAGLVDVDEELLRCQEDGTPGKYVAISVADNGIGMERAVMDRVFQPFYTTKEVGKGTGLGLTMIYGIVKEHKGFITVRSMPGNGADFAVYLPMLEQFEG